MPIEYGAVVLTLAGRDKGKYSAIVGIGDTAVLVADGKTHPIERPKHKNRKHISVTELKLTDSDMATNRSLRRALTALETALK